MKNTTTTTNTINSIASAIRTATTTRGELLNLCRDNAKTKQGRDRIAKACNIILDETREIQAQTKGFDNTDHYLKALDTRIDAKTKGAKNEKTNFLGWKCGHAKNKVAFYHIITTALADCVTSAASAGFKPVLSKDTDFKIVIEQKDVTKKVTANTPAASEEKPTNDADTSASSDNEEKPTTKAKSAIDTAIGALEALPASDLHTLANAMIHGSNDALKALVTEMNKIKEQEKANASKVQDNETKLADLQLKADKQKVALKLAKDKKLAAKTIKSRESAYKATNAMIADLMNQSKSMHLEATQY